MCVCVLWGKQVLGVNNVAPAPSSLAEAVLSAFSGHKGASVGNGVAVRAQTEMLPSSGVYPLCSASQPHPFPPVVPFFTGWQRARRRWV